MRARLPTILAAALAATGAGQPQRTIVTAVPFETLGACLKTKLSGMGTLTPINTAAGAMLDLGFESVAPDGRIATSHTVFSIEDRGIERRVTASPADPADGTLTAQLLAQAAAACAPDAAKR